MSDEPTGPKSAISEGIGMFAPVRGPEPGTADVANVALRWRNVVTVFVDQIVGYTGGDGVARITFGELVFAPNQPVPDAQPVITLAVTQPGIHRLLAQLQDIANAMSSTGSEA